MRYQKVISSPWMLVSALVIVVVVTAAFPRLQDWRDWSSYLQFVRHDTSYYEHLALDCDTFLRTHSIGSSGLVADNRARGWFGVTLSAVSLPESIRVLHPNSILVSTNCLQINCGSRGRPGWGFMWGEVFMSRGAFEPPTNTWVLSTGVPYKCERTLFVKKK